MKKSIEIRAVVNYLHILRPVRRPTERKSYYRLDVLVPKDDCSTLEQIVNAVWAMGAKLDDTDLLKDGDEKGHTLYKGCYYFTAKRASDLDPMKIEGIPRNGTVASMKLLPLRAYVGGAPSVTFRLESISFSN
ncbi:ssDNA-binding protein [uncultured Porphyromonas sp.]|uniref:ssDNA-binding protein n=1 Tax=uncultured Porphyromonas sp. TaxID=159274 RepID=UPI002596965D|nr:ssDNA-binding protein [uncultured Porphyromonas sp.]